MGKGNKSGIRRAFGVDDDGNVLLPCKVSNVAMSRIEHGNDRGCPFCFPHGFENSNGTCKKNRRSWKNQRKAQYKIR